MSMNRPPHHEQKYCYEDEFDDIVEVEPKSSELQAYQQQQLTLFDEYTVLSYFAS